MHLSFSLRWFHQWQPTFGVEILETLRCSASRHSLQNVAHMDLGGFYVDLPRRSPLARGPNLIFRSDRLMNCSSGALSRDVISILVLHVDRHFLSRHFHMTVVLPVLLCRNMYPFTNNVIISVRVV
ncbi:hypothetical protein PoB_006568500 [Plakobranchus ocellatus]|uniref:Uncharacterized protein n=1 Tax=Plakobranchus ocellatus TaxID=259542 RepID=A0AAV4D5A8_9GAST|nr:hypothetical protein PoB_006568500 [Plakobranchus ocellatus]